MLTDTTHSPAARVRPLPFGAVRWSGGLWGDRFAACAEGTVPQLERMFASKEISHVVENFRICAGEAQGEFDGTVFGDGDFYKWIEAALYVGALNGDTALLARVEGYIDLIARAQQPDGYLSTKQIIGERSANGVARMGDVNDFEVYNLGHLFTAACLHFRITGRSSFLRVAERAAGYLERLYTEAARTGKVQTAVCPSHYMGLVELARTTGNPAWLALARRAVSLRDLVKNGSDDNQDRLPLAEHRSIVGHAVRANYLYAGVADLCLEEETPAYRAVLESTWKSLVEKKLYLTGGCGALYNGASPYGNFFQHQLVHQAYGYEYQLPNITAYNETCAAVGAVLWAYRMFEREPKAEYFDVIERVLLNTTLAAFSLDGKKFFYENMLRRAKKLDFEPVWPLTRTEYILSYCCPPNLARTVAQSAEYAYSVSDNTVWVGLYGASRAELSLPGGAAFTLVQTTEYPFAGRIAFHTENAAPGCPAAVLQLRIPAWSQTAVLTVNGAAQTLRCPGSYCAVSLTDPAHDTVALELDMAPRLTAANAMVEEDCNQAAVERGPLVYCVETGDTPVGELSDLLLDPAAELRCTPCEIGGHRMTALEGRELCLERTPAERGALYHTLRPAALRRVPVRFVPYYAWDNRTHNGEMRIWLPVAYLPTDTAERAERAEGETPCCR